MADKWTVKELLSAIKMNQLGIPKYTDAEEIAIIDGSRLAGMVSYSNTNKALRIFQSGTGSTFNLTELTNYLFRDETNIGITTPKKTVYDEQFVNTKGKMNTSVFVSLEFLQETSVAGEVQIVVTDGSNPITVTDTLSSTPTPTKQYKTYIVDTTSFAANAVLQVQVKLTQVSIQFVEYRGI